MHPILLKCDGDSGTFPLPKKPDIVTFTTPGKCKLATFTFEPTDEPPGFKRLPANPDGSIPYAYDGRGLPDAGYSFKYKTGVPVILGNGTGVIKNG